MGWRLLLEYGVSVSAVAAAWGTGWTTWVQFAVFLVVGALVYALYGRRHSRLGATPPVAQGA